MLDIHSFTPQFGCEIVGLDLRQPIEDTTFDRVHVALTRYAVGVFRQNAPVPNQPLIDFSLRFGPIQRTPVLTITGRRERIVEPEIVDQSNLDHDGRIFPENDKRLLFKRANQQWHTDMSFHPVRATWSLLAAHVLPPSGADTEFADMRAAYDALPASMRARIESLEAEHSYWYSRMTAGGPPPDEAEQRSRPPARHPLVHVRHGRKCLYIASHAYTIAGWPEDEARALLRELVAHATRPEFLYRHKWRPGDVLIWDNLCTMHRATPFDDTTYPRDMRRTTCRERAID